MRRTISNYKAAFNLLVIGERQDNQQLQVTASNLPLSSSASPESHLRFQISIVGTKRRYGWTENETTRSKTK
ncbi:hypothetical protein Hanom_Chr07g00594381 [Helianthus anomalus]